MFHLAEFPKIAMSGNPYAKKRKILKAILWRHQSYSSFLSHEIALKRGFSLDGKNPFLRLIERCIKIQKHVYFEGNQGFAREGKILEFSYYPINKEFVFKISYACISTTSVGAMVCLFRFLAKIETEHGKPP